MKFSSVVASLMLVASSEAAVSSNPNALTVDNWKACVEDSDCKTTGFKCCEAYKLGYASANVCGAAEFSTVPSSGGVYSGFSFKCFAANTRDRWATC